MPIYHLYTSHYLFLSYLMDTELIKFMYEFLLKISIY
jgi:hypothetical protein